MNYENAPATKMLASNCACCSRPLVDAVSVEAGVGPDCRARHGFDEAQGPANWTEAQAELRLIAGGGYELPAAWNLDAHKVTNQLVYRIALEQEGEAVQHLTNAVRALGYFRLADRIAKRLARVRIEQDDEGWYVVRGPYSETAVDAFRRVPGRRWAPAQKANRIPPSSKHELHVALRRAYPGETAIGPRGLFTIGQAA